MWRNTIKLQYVITTAEGRPLSPFLLAKTSQNATGTNSKEVKSIAKGYEISLTEKEAEKLNGKTISDPAYSRAETSL